MIRTTLLALVLVGAPCMAALAAAPRLPGLGGPRYRQRATAASRRVAEPGSTLSVLAIGSGAAPSLPPTPPPSPPGAPRRPARPAQNPRRHRPRPGQPRRPACPGNSPTPWKPRSGACMSA
ncbi:MAG: hypothetical protein WDN04_11885 [Rhodospirillales bacterium]